MARANDPARKWTDKELKEMERHIGGIYDQALKEITEKWDAYMERTEKRLGNLYAAYVSAPEDKKADALEKYKKALENATFKNEWYRDMVKETTARLTRVNEIATAYINGKMPEIYKVNYDQIDPDALIPGIKYTMVDEHSVRNLIKNGTIPQKKVDEANDALWNTKQIGSAVLQGILQGESIPNIAKRIMPIVGRNEASAVRNARTMTTAAENRGRLDRYDDYESKGLIMQKVWIATGDSRTRDWHLSLDGQEVDKDEPFVDGNGNELQYPGDPDAAPETVWNCRCSMRSHITGVRGKSGKITPIADMHKTGLHQEQIEAERQRRGNKIAAKDKAPVQPEIRTRQEAYDVAGTMFGSIEKNMSRVDEKLLCENITQLKRLNDHFGVLTDKNIGYLTSKASGRAIAYTGTAYNRRTENTRLGLVAKHYGDRESFIAQELSARASNWSTPFTDEYASVFSITHEYGHMLEAKISMRRTVWGSRIGPDYVDDPRHEEKVQAHAITKEILAIARETNPDFSLSDNISRYGKTNDFEFFAEVFANSQCGAPNELGKAMLKWLEKEGY